MSKTVHRGQVWFHKPGFTPTGHIQKGPRPVIIVSNERLNQSSSVVLAVPCTTQIKRNFPTHALFVMNGVVNAVLGEQVCPVNVDELTTLEYILEDYIMDKVDESIQIALGYKSVSSNKVTDSLSSENISDIHSSKDTMVKVSDNSQVQKFYSKFPYLKPDSKRGKNKWSKYRIKNFIADYESSEDLESVAKKYNLTTSTMYTYYRKFKASEARDAQEGGA